MTDVTIHVVPPHPDHRCLVGIEDCGCIQAVYVLDHGHDADAYSEAAKWAKRGARIETMLVSEFRKLPFRCSGHPDGKWDSRGRVRPVQQAGLGL